MLINPMPTTTDNNRSPSPTLNGTIPSIAPSTVSPNKPPRPNECPQAAAGTWVEAKTDPSATAIGAKITRFSARSSPRWVISRTPQVRITAGMPQAPSPAMMISGDAMVAPIRPNRFCTGASVTAIQPGSPGA
ncbi:hypothetical protein GALL_465130 [mine drainage metagenome]|uniref:Uncharacterized protein n=1 Tax=mine drainage metagenome TaxID=410659 RepID=A0A1J5PWE2_9ZZZZ